MKSQLKGIMNLRSRKMNWGSCTSGKILVILFLVLFCFSRFSSSEEALQVGFLVLDRVYNTELMAPYDIFHHTRFHTKPGMEVFTISPRTKTITTFEDLKLQTNYTLRDAPRIDILVIPSAEHNMDSDLRDVEVKEWIRKTVESARYVVTLCDGAFLLANTGLLNGKKATTFPSDLPRFREMFPEIDALEGFSFVHDGKYLTSQGGAKSYDVALYLVDLLYGEAVAAGVGKGLVLPWKNPAILFFHAEHR